VLPEIQVIGIPCKQNRKIHAESHGDDQMGTKNRSIEAEGT